MRFRVEPGRLDFTLPRVVRVRQRLDARREGDVSAAVSRELARAEGQVRPGMSVAVGVGSRGLADLDLIVRTCIAALRRMGAYPFIVPAMGSHGGSTAEGQRAILAGYGVTPESMGVEVRDDMAVALVGRCRDGTPVYFSREALAADAVLPINRVKVHTGFHGPVESGLSKMLAVGFGKHTGAAALHRRGADTFDRLIPEAVGIILQRVPVVGGLATVENAFEQVASLEWVPTADIPRREPDLLALSRRLMPTIPFTDVDVLVVDRIGKDISGDGMDPNITGRHTSSRMRSPGRNPRRIVVLRLTERTHGNVCGLGLADLTTAAVVEHIDYQATWTNTVTSLDLGLGKTPMWVGDDRTAIALALDSCVGVVPREARLVRVASTLHLHQLWVSEALWLADGAGRDELEALGGLEELTFTPEGHLRDLALPF